MSGTPYVFDGRKFSKYFLIVAFGLSLAGIVALVWSFILQILLAVVMAILVHPLFRWFLRLTRDRRGLAAVFACLTVLGAVFVPAALIMQIVVDQGVELYRTAGAGLSELVRQGNQGIVARITDSGPGRWLELHRIAVDWEAVSVRALAFMGDAATGFVNAMSRATVHFIFNLFIILFSLFYFLRDGQRMLQRAKELLPISDDYKERIIDRFYRMTNAIVKGVVLIAIIQSVLGTLTLWAFGVKAWLLWGVVMLVLAVIPFVGTGVVLVPAGVFKIITGDPLQGLAIIAISVFFISTIDNVLRPKIVGQHAGMHNLLVFFAIIGGVLTFGPSGLVVGPLIAAVFLTILEIYRIEFLPHFDHLHGQPPTEKQ